MWNKFIKLVLKIASPSFAEAVAAKTKNPQAAQANSKILKSLSGGKVLSLTKKYGNGHRLTVMRF